MCRLLLSDCLSGTSSSREAPAAVKKAAAQVSRVRTAEGESEDGEDPTGVARVEVTPVEVPAADEEAHVRAGVAGTSIAGEAAAWMNN